MKYTITATEEFVQVQSDIEWDAPKAQAVAIAATFPKSCKVLGTTIHRTHGDFGFVTFRATLKANGVHGLRNETGIKRVNMALKHIAATGGEVEYNVFGNSITAERLSELLS